MIDVELPGAPNRTSAEQHGNPDKVVPVRTARLDQSARSAAAGYRMVLGFAIASFGESGRFCTPPTFP